MSEATKIDGIENFPGMESNCSKDALKTMFSDFLIELVITKETGIKKVSYVNKKLYVQ